MFWLINRVCQTIKLEEMKMAFLKIFDVCYYLMSINKKRLKDYDKFEEEFIKIKRRLTDF